MKFNGYKLLKEEFDKSDCLTDIILAVLSVSIACILLHVNKYKKV